MFQYSSQQLAAEVERIIVMMQQNERNNANTLRAMAGQLQNLAATENQAVAMLQQLHAFTSQIVMEASRVANMGFQQQPVAYEPTRTNTGSNLAANSVAQSQNAGLSGMGYQGNQYQSGGSTSSITSGNNSGSAYGSTYGANTGTSYGSASGATSGGAVTSGGNAGSGAASNTSAGTTSGNSTYGQS